MTINTPDAVARLNRFAAFGLSLLTVAVPSYDMRLGGFGPVMPLMLAVVLVGVIRWRRLFGAAALCVMAYAVVSCFLFSQSWWARYVCQLWLVMPVAAAALYHGGHRPRMAASVLLWLGLLTGASAAVVAVGQALLLSLQRHELYEAARHSSRPVGICNATRQACRHFTEQNIPTVCVADEDMATGCGMMFYGLPGQSSMPAVLLPAEAFGELSMALDQWPGVVSARLFDYSECESGL